MRDGRPKTFCSVGHLIVTCDMTRGDAKAKSENSIAHSFGNVVTIRSTAKDCRKAPTKSSWNIWPLLLVGADG